MHKISTWNIVFFIAALLEICLSVSVERVETLKVIGLKITVSTRSTHQIKFSIELLSVDMKNNMHYSKQYTADSTSVKFAALVIANTLFNP